MHPIAPLQKLKHAVPVLEQKHVQNPNQALVLSALLARVLSEIPYLCERSSKVVNVQERVLVFRIIEKSQVRRCSHNHSNSCILWANQIQKNIRTNRTTTRQNNLSSSPPKSKNTRENDRGKRKK